MLATVCRCLASFQVPSSLSLLARQSRWAAFRHHSPIGNNKAIRGNSRLY